MNRGLQSPMMLSLILSLTAGQSLLFAQDESGRGPRGRGDDKGLKVGEMAPTFKLKSLDGKAETDLAGFRGKKPVVLFFGSYT